METVISRKHCLISYLLLAAVFCWDDLFCGPYSIMPFGDILDSAFLINNIEHGRILLEEGLFGWFSTFVGGLPGMVNHQPPWALQSFVLQIVPVWFYYLIFQILQFGLAGYGMYVFLFRFMGRQRALSYWGGIAYALSTSFSFVFVFIPLFPLVFVWTMEVFDPGMSFRKKLLRLTAFVLISLSSFPVFTVPYIAICHFACVLAFGLKQNGKRRLVGTIVLWTGYVLFFIPFFYGLYEYVPFVSRSWNYSYDGFVQATASFGYGFISVARAAPVLILFLVCLAYIKLKPLIWKTLLFAFCPVVISSFFISDFMFFLKDTFWVKMDLAHFAHLSQFGMVLFCVCVLDELIKNKIRIHWMICIVSIAFSLLVCNENQMLRDLAVFATVMPLFVFARDGEVATAKKASFFSVVFVVGVCLSMMITSQRWELTFTHAPYKRVYEQTEALSQIKADRDIFRVACFDLHPCIARSQGLEAVGARPILTNERYKKYFETFMAPLLSDPESLEKFRKQKYVIHPMPLADYHNDNVNFDQLNFGVKRNESDWRIPMIAGLGVKYILSQTPVAGMDKWAELVAETNGPGAPFEFLKGTEIDDFYSLPMWIYRLNEPLGIARFASKVALFNTDEEVLNAMANANISTMGDTVFLSNGNKKFDSDNNGRVDSFERTADKMVISGHSDGPGYVLVMTNWDPHWAVSVNGQQAPVVRANHAFMAVYVPAPGGFSIEFKYSNKIISWLHVATILGLLLMISCIWVAPRGEDMNTRLHDSAPVSLFHNVNTPLKMRVFGAGIAMSAVWLLTFYLFIYLKSPDVPLTPYKYMMMQIPIMGVLLSGWATWVMGKKI